MRVRRGAVAIAWIACAGLIFGGCGTSDRDQVRAKVDQFLKATAGKDYRTLCDQVLAPALLSHLAAGGIACVQAMQIALEGVKSPALSIGRVDVNGDQASVITLTTASGQQASLDAIELTKTGKGWRVASLGTPVVPKSK
jgi:predicted metal-dependent phosphotriesterase family hydrolase